MEQRITLISDATDEFPNNTNNSFRTRIPGGLRLEGEGWHVALLSLTLPNSKKEDGLLKMNSKKQVLAVGYTIMELYDKNGSDYRRVALSAKTDTVVGDSDLRSPPTTGVGFWTLMVDLVQEKIHGAVEAYRTKVARIYKRNNSFVMVKRSMRPSFRWEGDELILESAGGDVGHITSSSTTFYSFFDMSVEVALQWGFLVEAPKQHGYLLGPNCSYTMDNVTITDSYPPRTSSIKVDGISNLNGKAYHSAKRADHPAILAPSTTAYDIFWVYISGGAPWVRFSRAYEWRFRGFNETFANIHNHSSKAVLVYTNLQQSSIVGNTKAQLLRELVVKRGTEHGEHTYTEPLHLQWVPVSTHQTDIVEVQLADVNGDLSSLPKGKSLVTMALKQIV